MVNVNNVLSTRYWLSDDAMAVGYFWGERAALFCSNCGYSCLDLTQENATRENFESSLVSHDPVFFHGWGHGNQTEFTGYGINTILEACVNDQLLATRITYLMSCKTGAQLGPSIISKGGWGYIGYSDSYWTMDFYYALNSPSSAPFGRYHWGNLDHTNFIVNGILKGQAISQAHTRSLQRLQAWIDYWSQSGDPYASDAVANLTMDRDCQVQLGDANAAITPPVAGKHVRDCYAVGFNGLLTLSGVRVSMKVGCSCHVDDCNFTGKRWTLRRGDTGEVVASGTFTSFDRGLNFADVSFTAPDVEGEFNYQLVVEGDELHDETIGNIKVFTTHVDLKVLVFDELFGNSVYKAKVTVNGETSETDHQGITSIEIKHPGVYTITVEAKGFESQTRSLTVTGEQSLMVEKFFLRPVGEGIFFEGYVKDAVGNPVKDALVLLGTMGMSVKTNSSGYYKIPQDFTLPRGVAYPLTVVHSDYKPQSILTNARSMNTSYVVNFTLEPIEPNTIYLVGNTRDQYNSIEVPNPNYCFVQPLFPWWTADAFFQSNYRGLFIVKIVVSGWREGTETFIANVFINKTKPEAELPPPPYDQYFKPPRPSYLGVILRVSESKRVCRYIGWMELGADYWWPRNWVLKGFLTDDAYNPLSGVNIRIHGIPVYSYYDYPLEPETWYTAVTDENGFFEVTVAQMNTLGILYEFEINYGNRLFEYAKIMFPVTTDLSRKLPPPGVVWKPASSPKVQVNVQPL